MTVLASVDDLLLLVLVSLAPALAYLAWVRKGERRRTEGWGSLAAGFAYGAIFATFVAGILEVILHHDGGPYVWDFAGVVRDQKRKGSGGAQAELADAAWNIGRDVHNHEFARAVLIADAHHGQLLGSRLRGGRCAGRDNRAAEFDYCKF